MNMRCGTRGDILKVGWATIALVVCGNFTIPRWQKWSDHFQLVESIITPLTSNGRVTAKMLHFNDPDRIEERERLIAVNLYP